MKIRGNRGRAETLLQFGGANQAEERGGIPLTLHTYSIYVYTQLCSMYVVLRRKKKEKVGKVGRQCCFFFLLRVSPRNRASVTLQIYPNVAVHRCLSRSVVRLPESFLFHPRVASIRGQGPCPPSASAALLSFSVSPRCSSSIAPHSPALFCVILFFAKSAFAISRAREIFLFRRCCALYQCRIFFHRRLPLYIRYICIVLRSVRY